jgi:hypothetical protein
MHDTFAKEGRAAWPDLPYLTPSRFAEASSVQTKSLDSPPPAWAGEIDMLKLEGTKKKEHVLFHRPSRTLVVADLFFSFPPGARGWSRFFARHIMRLPPTLFGVSRFFRLLIEDKEAFAGSVRELLKCDFERILVAHWAPIETAAKSRAEQALRESGLLSKS